MQEDHILTRARKRFRGNIEDTAQFRARHRAETPERFNEGLRQTPMLLLDNGTQTTSPPKQNTSAGSSQGGLVRTPQIPTQGQTNPSSAQL
jgi:hypothetical protein